MLFLCLIIFFIGCFLFISRSNISYVGNELLVLVISIPDLFFIPEDDLSRYFNELMKLSSYDNFFKVIVLSKYDSVLKRNSGCIIYYFLEWLVSRTTIYNLLPFVVVFIVYSCFSLPSIYQRNKWNISLFDTIFCIGISMVIFPYLNISSTLRWGLGCALFFLITYICCYKYDNHIIVISLFYISLYFIHEALLLPSLIAIVCILLDYLNIKNKHYISIIFLALCILLVPFIYFNSEDSEIFQEYKNTTYAGWGIGFYISMLIPFFLDIGCLFMFYDNKKKFPKIYKRMFLLFNMLYLLFLPILIISQRYSSIVVIIDIICYLKGQRDDIIKINYIVNICFYMVFIFLCIFSITSIFGMSFSNNIIHY